MSLPLDIDFENKRNFFKREVAVYDDMLQERISYILDTIYSLFSETKTSWYFPDANEGEVGSFDNAIEGDYVFITVCNYISNMKVKFADGKYLHLCDSLPLRWLFNPFEDELKEAKQRLDDEVAEKKRKSAEKKANRKEHQANQERLRQHQKEIMKAVENKLTPEELAVLRLKIKV